MSTEAQTRDGDIMELRHVLLTQTRTKAALLEGSRVLCFSLNRCHFIGEAQRKNALLGTFSLTRLAQVRSGAAASHVHFGFFKRALWLLGDKGAACAQTFAPQRGTLLSGGKRRPEW